VLTTELQQRSGPNLTTDALIKKTKFAMRGRGEVEEGYLMAQKSLNLHAASLLTAKTGTQYIQYLIRKEEPWK